ncbi:MAG: SMC-Scp complex subunit ScpB [Alphaproteobacteria bacterium]|nr:SMC-Scp complex subunit ScpB [Alphaproteobacteria bacterium]
MSELKEEDVMMESQEVVEEAVKEKEPAIIEPMDEEQILKALEAMLFASSKPLSPQMMLERLPEGTDLNVLLPQLKERYAGRGVELVELGGLWAMRTSAEVADSLIVEKEVSKKMSKAALETMAIVAYHQPIARAEIENIRGVATHKGTLDILMEMGWVKPGRRRETPGRPLTWVTTPGFLDHFQLENLNDLPGLEELKASGLMDKRAAIDTLPDTGDLFDNPDEDAEEVLDQSDEDAYDEASYHEMKREQSRSGLELEVEDDQSDETQNDEGEMQ